MSTASHNAPKGDARQRLVLVTGPSGAGRSTALNILEDLRYEVIDNLPLSLIPRLFKDEPAGAPLALGIDVRNREFSTGAMVDLMAVLRADQRLDAEILFLDCSDTVLLRRYSETRRRHPMAPAESPDVGIARERDLLNLIRVQADTLIDTSEMNQHALKTELTRWFGDAGEARLAVSVHSFSYKRGVPRGADMVFDCRFLTNPYWQPELRGLNGLSPEVAQYVKGDKRFPEFAQKVCDLVLFLLPQYLTEGKSHLSVAFGCTGGQHRSVTMAENLSAALAEAGWRVSKRHRELERQARIGAGTQ